MYGMENGGQGKTNSVGRPGYHQSNAAFLPSAEIYVNLSCFMPVELQLLFDDAIAAAGLLALDPSEAG